MSNSEEDSFDFNELPACPVALSLDAAEQMQVEAWTSQFGAELLKQVRDLLTVLDSAVMSNGEKATITAIGMTPAVQLDVKKEKEHLTELASGAARILKMPEQVNKIRSIFVYLLRKGFKTFKTKNCIPGSTLNYEKIQTLLSKKKDAYNQEVLEKPEDIPESIFVSDLKSRTSVALMKSLINTRIPEKIKNDPAEMNNRIVRAVGHAVELYNDLGNKLFEQGPRVEAMYQHLTGGPLKLPPANPLTALDSDTVGTQGFTSLAWNFLEGMNKAKTAYLPPKEAGDLYHTQVILWLSIVFFQLDLQAARSKAGITQVTSKEVTNFIIQKLEGGKIANRKETINGRKEPITYRKIRKNRRDYEAYAGETIIKTKTREASLLKIMRCKRGKDAFVLVDEIRGEMMINKNSNEFYEGSDLVKDSEQILTELAEYLGCTVVPNNGEYDKLKPGEAMVVPKLGESSKPESFEFATVKLYAHLQFCETKEGAIVLIKDEATRAYALANHLEIYSARLEYRIVPKDTWVDSHYDVNNPTHHDHFRLQQMMEIMGLSVRPAESKDLYDYKSVVEQMFTESKEAIKKAKQKTASQGFVEAALPEALN